MAEITGTTFTEIPTYAFSALIADIGGSLGLVLGLSLIGKKIVFCKILQKFFFRYAFYWKKIIPDENNKEIAALDQGRLKKIRAKT